MCVCASGVNTILLFAIISRWVFELLLQFLGDAAKEQLFFTLACDVSEMSKTPLPLIAFALLAHFHTFTLLFHFLQCSSLVIVATLSSPANYFLALSHLHRKQKVDLSLFCSIL